jgi:hypothetical protein
MSYGKEFLINGKNYLIEKNDEYIYVAEKLSEDNYKAICEMENYYDLFFWDEEKRQLDSIPDYDERLYAICLQCLNNYSIVDSKKDYSTYIENMLKDMTKEEILNSDSDERLIYLLNYPLDFKAEKFKEVTTDIINDSKLYNAKNFLEENKQSEITILTDDELSSFEVSIIDKHTSNDFTIALKDDYVAAINEANKYSDLLNIEFDVNAVKENVLEKSSNEVRTLLNENQKEDYSL